MTRCREKRTWNPTMRRLRRFKRWQLMHSLQRSWGVQGQRARWMALAGESRRSTKSTWMYLRHFKE